MVWDVLPKRNRLLKGFVFVCVVLVIASVADRMYIDYRFEEQTTACLTSVTESGAHPDEAAFRLKLADSDKALCSKLFPPNLAISAILSFRHPMTSEELKKFIADEHLDPWLIEKMGGRSGIVQFYIGPRPHLLGGSSFSNLTEAMVFVDRVHPQSVTDERDFLSRLQRKEGYLASWNTSDAETHRLSEDLAFDETGPHYSAIGITMFMPTVEKLAALHNIPDVRYVWDADQMGPRPHGVNPLDGEWR